MDKLEQYMTGFLTKPEIEGPGPKRGDPQRSALVQYLLDTFGSTRTPDSPEIDAFLVDFGSGAGALADELERLLPAFTALPLYIAVDLPEPLARLALPVRIHNRSQKWTVSEFYGDFLPKYGKRISMVILRNVLHEMNIEDTSALFANLDRFIPGPADLYIQDVTTLPKHERGNAGWAAETLSEFLAAIGMKASVAKQESYQGTAWFIVRTKLPGTVHDVQRIEEHCAVCRQKQYDEMLRETETLNQLTDEASALRLIQLQGDCTSISLQIRQWEVKKGRGAAVVDSFTSLAQKGVHVAVDKLSASDFAIEVPSDVYAKTGLIAILSSKAILDFPTLYRSCRSELLFSGYSQRLLFATDGNRESLRSLVNSGRRVRILLVDPKSEPAALRAASPAYNGPEELVREIADTVASALAFNRGLEQEMPNASGSEHNRVEVKLTPRPPPCSYFFVDNLCFMSLYSDRLTGSRGFCFVFAPTKGAHGSYFHFLIEDFRSEWDRGSGVRFE
jgi:hypothetical protein